MTKNIIVLVILSLNLMVGRAQSEIFNVESFDGNKASIGLFYKEASGILAINYLQDTLLIDDYLSVDTVEVLDKVFLLVKYSKRAGSNEDSRNQLLLYVFNGKLCQALHIHSLWNYDMRPKEYSLYKLRAKLSGQDANTYKLAINLHCENRSSSNPASNYNYNKIISLSFDKKNRVFYSRYEHVKGYYNFFELSENSTKNKYITNDVPVVGIGKYKYYYINGNWYAKYKSDFNSMLL